MRQVVAVTAAFIGLATPAQAAEPADAGVAAGARAAPSLTPPAATPRAFGDADDFPFVTPLAGAKLLDSQADDAPLDIAPALGVAAPALVGAGTLTKKYQGPEGLSPRSLFTAYQEAFRKAGWTVLQPQGAAAALYAHFDESGRDVWAKLACTQGSRWSVTVADVGSAVRRKLDRGCKAELYGVTFATDTATLTPESTAVLQQVLAVFTDDPKLRGQVGGHTDDAGDAAANRRLSQQRAEAVRAWLVQHGVARGRIVSRGFGDSQPLVANDTPEHRARNRRMELKTSGCRGR